MPLGVAHPWKNADLKLRVLGLITFDAIRRCSPLRVQSNGASDSRLITFDAIRRCSREGVEVKPLTIHSLITFDAIRRCSLDVT